MDSPVKSDKSNFKSLVIFTLKESFKKPPTTIFALLKLVL